MIEISTSGIGAGRTPSTLASSTPHAPTLPAEHRLQRRERGGGLLEQHVVLAHGATAHGALALLHLLALLTDALARVGDHLQHLLARRGAL